MKDRRGYGDESDSEDFLKPSEAYFSSSFLPGSAPVTKILIILTSVMWVIQIILSSARIDLAYYLGLSPERVTDGFEVWRLLTMMLVHEQQPFHILFNMFTLWMFGREVERSLGSWRFLRFYVFAGLAASLLYLVVHLFGAPFAAAIGASGAVIGVMVLFACLYPDVPVLAFLFIPMKAKHLVMLLVGLDLIYFVGMKLGEDGVAHSAHLGGAAFGFVYFRYATRIRSWLSGWEKQRERQGRERDRQVKLEVDELLTKISREGMDALTPRERRFLKEASRHFRDP